MGFPQESPPWSGNPNAPKITSVLHLEEKATFAGTFIGSILYGVVVVLFFQCAATLVNPVRRIREPIKWGLVFHTTAMFSVATIFTAMNLNIQSISFIDNRRFVHRDEGGPLGYQWSIRPMAISMVPGAAFVLNGLLADGLLLYRCYVIYSMNLWVIALPCLIYIGSLGTGILMVLSLFLGGTRVGASIVSDYGLPYLSVSVSLNILLTLIIVTRLVLHSRNIRAATGTPAGIGGLYKTIITMLIESCALYAVSSLLVIAPPGDDKYLADIFLPILAETQVIAPLLIIQRVANKSALTSNTVVSGHISSLKAGTREESTGGSSTISGGRPVSSADEYGINSRELLVGVETRIGSHQD